MKTRPRPRRARQSSRRLSRPPARRRRKPAWGIHAAYSRVTTKTRRDWRRFRLTLRSGLERDTRLMPWLLAESVCGEVARFVDVEIPARYAAWLAARAALCYAKRGRFWKRMRGRGNAPRDWLRVFMRHWLAGLLGTERPDLYECLPDTYALGHPLPEAVRPRRRWHGNGNPLYAPLDWNPQRVLQHRRWRWLMRRLAAGMEAERATLQDGVAATDQQVDRLVYELHGIREGGRRRNRAGRRPRLAFSPRQDPHL